MPVLINLFFLLGALFLFVLFLYALLRVTRYYQARRLVEKAIQDDQLIAKMEDKKELIDLARRLTGVGQYERAISVWNRFMAVTDEISAALIERGKLFYQLGKYEDALQDLKKVVETQEEPFPEVYLYLARCYREKDNIQHALQYYSSYFQAAPENLPVAFEVAAAAREGREFEEAKKSYERIRTRGVQELYIEATLELVKMALQNDDFGAVIDYLKDIYQLEKRGKICRQDALRVRYHHARLLEKENKLKEALHLYQYIYKIQPDFRDVDQNIGKHVANLGSDELLNDYLAGDITEFLVTSENIVKAMGFTISESRIITDEAVRIDAQKKTSLWRIENVLFAFKQWDYQIGEWPLREFEMEIIEGKFQTGHIVVPGGFKPSAIKYARNKKRLQLMGSDELVNYLRKSRRMIVGSK